MADRDLTSEIRQAISNELRRQLAEGGHLYDMHTAYDFLFVALMLYVAPFIQEGEQSEAQCRLLLMLRRDVTNSGLTDGAKAWGNNILEALGMSWKLLMDAKRSAKPQ